MDSHPTKPISAYSIKELRAICQASAPNPSMETWTGRLTRVFSIYTTKLFLYTSITPNQITVISLLIFFAAAAVYWSPSYYVTLLGPMLHFFSIVVDGNDGEVARFRKQNSKFGANYVEPVSHDIQYGFFFLVIALGLYYNGASVFVLVAGALASITKLLYRSLQIRFWYSYYAGTAREQKEEQVRQYEERAPLVKLFYFLNRNLYSNPGFVIPLVLSTIFARMDIFIYFYAASFTALFLVLLAKQMRIISRSFKSVS